MKTDLWRIVFSILSMFIGVFEFILEHDRLSWWTWLNRIGWIGLGFLLLAGSNRAEMIVIASPIVVILLSIGEFSVQHRTWWRWFQGWRPLASESCCWPNCPSCSGTETRHKTTEIQAQHQSSPVTATAALLD